jgi:integrase
MSKSPAGTPQVKLSNGRLQIVLTYGGKRKYISLGLSESKQNRDYADMVRSWIQNDLRCNNFDPSLDRYRREDTTTDPDKPKAVEPTIRELWDRYTNYKRPQLALSTIAKDFDSEALPWQVGYQFISTVSRLNARWCCSGQGLPESEDNAILPSGF